MPSALSQVQRVLLLLLTWSSLEESLGSAASPASSTVRVTADKGQRLELYRAPPVAGGGKVNINFDCTALALYFLTVQHENTNLAGRQNAPLLHPHVQVDGAQILRGGGRGRGARQVLPWQREASLGRGGGRERRAPRWRSLLRHQLSPWKEVPADHPVRRGGRGGREGQRGGGGGGGGG